ncbi:MAG: WD40 repeat domain-containing protein [Planctomycetota bacterium]|jgi:WD40 repeat protein
MRDVRILLVFLTVACCVAVGADGQEARRTSLPTGAEMRIGTLRFSHGTKVSAVTFTPDGKSLVSAGDDRTVKKWRILTGTCQRISQFRALPTAEFTTLADGRAMIPRRTNGYYRWLDAISGGEVLSLSAEVASYSVLTISRDGKRIAIGNDSISVWDADTGQRKREWRTGIRQIKSMMFSPRGDKLAACGWRGKPCIVNIAANQITDLAAAQGTEADCVAFSTDGLLVAAGCADGSVVVWSSSRGRREHVFRGHNGRVNAVTFSPSGKTLASGGYDGRTVLRDLETGLVIFETGHPRSSVESLAFSPDGSLLASGGWQCGAGTVRVYDLGTKRELFENGGQDGWVFSLLAMPDGRSIVASGEDGTIRRLSLKSGGVLGAFEGHEGWVTALALSPDGRRLASGGEDRTVRIWDVGSRRELCRARGRSWVYGLAFTPGGDRLAGAIDDQVPTVWDARTGGEVLTIWKQRVYGVRTATMRPDGRVLVLGHDKCALSPDGRLNRYSSAIAEPGPGQLGRLMDAAFTPDGKRMVSVHIDGNVLLWDSEPSRELRRARSVRVRLRCVSVSPSGKLAAAGGDDGTVRLYDTKSLKLVRELRGHAGPVTAVAFTPDSLRLVSGSADSTILVWKAQE